MPTNTIRKDVVAEDARVEGLWAVASAHYRLRLRAPGITRRAKPGQFVNILCGGGTLLRRPLSIHRTERPRLRPHALRAGRVTARGRRTGRCFEVLFRVVGPGTKALSRLARGDELPVLGPLGRGFEIPRALRTAVLVGGGCGTAPLYALAEELRIKGIETFALIGAEDEDTLPVVVSKRGGKLPFGSTGGPACLKAADLEDIGVKTGLATMRGRSGFVGPVADMLELFLDAQKVAPRGTAVFASGPWGMLKQTAGITARFNVRCQVLLEEMMGCGIGACMSCVIKVRLPDGEVGQKRVCIDGPMFDADEVCWDAK